MARGPWLAGSTPAGQHPDLCGDYRIRRHRAGRQEDTVIQGFDLFESFYRKHKDGRRDVLTYVYMSLNGNVLLIREDVHGEHSHRYIRTGLIVEVSFPRTGTVISLLSGKKLFLGSIQSSEKGCFHRFAERVLGGFTTTDNDIPPSQKD